MGYLITLWTNLDNGGEILEKQKQGERVGAVGYSCKEIC
jgi:hypothetical protein